MCHENVSVTNETHVLALVCSSSTVTTTTLRTPTAAATEATRRVPLLRSCSSEVRLAGTFLVLLLFSCTAVLQVSARTQPTHTSLATATAMQIACVGHS